MKLGLFWLGKLDREIDLAIQFLARSNCDGPFDQLILFTDKPQPNTKLFVRETTKYPYDTINDLQDVFYHASNNDLDFALISFGNGFPVSLSRLATLLASEPVQEAIWSFRICLMTGVGFRHWPRLPNVDDHFILLNVRRAAETAFFDRKLIHASHFSHVGGRHSHLTSMIEYAMDQSEFFDHFVPEASKNQFGRSCRYDSMPFNLCEATGFLSCYADFKPALYELLRRNLDDQYSESAASLDRLRYFRRDEFWYFRPLLNISNVVNAIKRPFNLGRFEFQKRYEGES